MYDKTNLTVSEFKMKFGESDFGDLLASAEQLTADIDGGRAGDLPRNKSPLEMILFEIFPFGVLIHKLI